VNLYLIEVQIFNVTLVKMTRHKK